MYVALLGIGSAMAVFGFLQAAHPPFQKWWYKTRWYNPDPKKIKEVNSVEYKTAVFHMKVAGGKAALVGALLVLFSLSQLGLI
jgi:hypothetical protein